MSMARCLAYALRRAGRVLQVASVAVAILVALNWIMPP